ncbi:plasmid recombination protein [Gluconobacter sp. P1D12_c]|uniref:plasmid recombination protein n=1 Tax=Gluconobacter sp. P1D12_c TaxID=2762614 RepID=UPI00207B4C78|nr:plasmid recombination protein [Gluconobacter sp. P1D12_c]
MNEALRWIQERHGKDNVIAAIIHRDEKTPHLSAYVVPKDPDTGRLNCRRFLGGAKALNEMQTDFARVVGRPVGLERCIEGSKATDTKLKTYYGAL